MQYDAVFYPLSSRTWNRITGGADSSVSVRRAFSERSDFEEILTRIES